MDNKAKTRRYPGGFQVFLTQLGAEISCFKAILPYRHPAYIESIMTYRKSEIYIVKKTTCRKQVVFSGKAEP